MFTMKKFATLAVAGFFAASMFACSDDPEDEAGSSSSDVTPSSASQGANWSLSDITGTGWTKTATIVIGGSNNSSVGSALDIDALATAAIPTVYNVGNGTGPAATNKQSVDLLFDGSNLFTPAGCLSSTACPASFKTAMTGVDVPTSSRLFMSPSVTPSMTTTEIFNTFFAPGGASLNSGVVALGNAPVTQKGVYYVETSDGYYALILVGGGNFGATVTGETTLTLVAAN